MWQSIASLILSTRSACLNETVVPPHKRAGFEFHFAAACDVCSFHIQVLTNFNTIQWNCFLNKTLSPSLFCLNHVLHPVASCVQKISWQFWIPKQAFLSWHAHIWNEHKVLQSDQRFHLGLSNFVFGFPQPSKLTVRVCFAAVTERGQAFDSSSLFTTLLQPSIDDPPNRACYQPGVK